MATFSLLAAVLLLLACTSQGEKVSKRRPDYVVDEVPPLLHEEPARVARIPIDVLHNQDDTNFTFTSHNKVHTLKLEPNNFFHASKVPVRLVGMSQKEEADIVKEFQGIELKKDSRYLSSMAFKKSTKQFLNGAFKFGSHNFHINVAGDNSSEARVARDELKFEGNLKDKLRAKVDKEKSKRESGSNSRQKRDVVSTAPIQASIEVVYIIDYSMYNSFVTRSITTSESGSPVINVLLYVAHMATMINDFYATMQNDDISITVKVAGLIVITSQSELTTLTEDHRVYLDSAYKIDSDTVLENLADWLSTSQEAQDLIPPTDHTMLLTAYDMYDETDLSDGTIGLAFLGKICSPGKASSMVEMGYLLTYDASTAAHELGHNLGAGHDEVDSSGECADDNFVMAAYSKNPNYLSNRFLFSCCSQRSFYGILAAANCTDAGVLSLNNATITNHVDQYLPGEIFDADDQCYISHGTEACGSWAYDDPEDICLDLWCVSSDDSDYCITERTAAADGTSCGTSMWCIHGSCVGTAESVPSTTDQNCDVSDCYGFEFKCVDGSNSVWPDMNRCLPESWRCDDEADCSDGSDEATQMCAGSISTQHLSTSATLINVTSTTSTTSLGQTDMSVTAETSTVTNSFVTTANECWLCGTTSNCLTSSDQCAVDCPNEPDCESDVNRWLNSYAGRVTPVSLLLMGTSSTLMILLRLN